MSDPDFQYALLLQKQLEHESKSTSSSLQDREYAMLLQQQFEQEDSTESPKALVYNMKTSSTTKDFTKSLVDPSWEIIDPTPDIHTLFVAFNERFFWNKLLIVCVSWSKRMTSCAGICSYQGKGGMCSITLSEPLLKLRPRKDLVETLLHEMIHAYLFVTNNNRDRDGHGPEFHKHMYRINKEAGTNITVYHSFHDEVRLYKQHWWRCNGPCQYRSPYFGMVKRATNRAPGPNDRWWAEHSRTCGGEFIKIKEPGKKQQSSNKENKSTKKASSQQKNGIENYFPVLQDKNKTTGGSSNLHGFDNNGNITKINAKATNTQHKINPESTCTKKNSSSTVVITKSKNTVTTAKDKKTNAKSATTQNGNILGGSTKTNDYSDVRNYWSNKFSGKRLITEGTIEPKNKKSKQEVVSCPVCQEQQTIDLIDSHLDNCLKQHSEKTESESDECIICGEFYPKNILEQHVADCVNRTFNDKDFNLEECEMNKKENQHECPVCYVKVNEVYLDSHIENCYHNTEVEKRKNKEKNLPDIDTVVIKDDEEETIRHVFESSYLDDEAEKKYNCPFCFNMFLKNEMCDHLDECVRNEMDTEEGLNKSILLEDLNNVDF